MERYAGAVVGILSEQSPTKIGIGERNCVQDTLNFAVEIVVVDLKIQLHRGDAIRSTDTNPIMTTTKTLEPVPPICGECILIDTMLTHILNKKKAFYKGPKGNNQNHHHPNNNNNWHHNQPLHNNNNNNNQSMSMGYPEVRIRNIEKFRACGGFNLLVTYLLARLPYCLAVNTTNTTNATSGTTVTNGTAASTSTANNNSNVPPTGTGMTTPSYCFPSLETIHHILTAVFDTLPTHPVTMNANHNNNDNLQKFQAQQQLQQQQEMDAIHISKAIMKYLQQLSNDDIKKLPMDLFAMTFKILQKIFDRLIVTHRAECIEFYSFYRSIILSMISSTSLPLKLSGWEQVNELIKACNEHRPPPRQFRVSDAGCPLVNGTYEFAGTITPDGYAKPGADVLYVRTIPSDAVDGAGKKLTLFRCTMRSQQKWWFLSEADEEQPGTDRDIDYYQHKSKEHEEAYPPPGGWITCRNAGVNPPPTLEPIGYMVPVGEEMNTFEHQLAKWAIENAIVEQVLGDTTIHREIVTRSTVLIKFLASMCTRDDRIMDLHSSSSTSAALLTKGEQQTPNMYCLQTSHLLYAWKTCTRKADAAVSLQVYQLLVSILPLCPSQLAIPLLRAIQTSLHESSDKRDYLFEVSEFCSALAALNLVEVSSKNQAAAIPGTALTEEVREEVLNLLWSVLTHPGVSALKTYDSLKRYVTRELKVEPKGTEIRERFLQTCITVLSDNAEKITGSSVDEAQALRIVKLTLFILEACPRSQADAIVLRNNGALPMLLFREVVAYLQRRRDKVLMRPSKGVSRKPSLSNMSIGPTTSFNSNIGFVQNDTAQKLADRLRMLRHVFGLSENNPTSNDPISMSASMINTLWDMCLDTPLERESLMLFIASASHPSKVAQFDRAGAVPHATSHTSSTLSPGGSAQTDPLLSAAFSDEVCYSVFLNLFCSESFDYDQLGSDGYWSFHFLFKRLSNSANSSVHAKKSALDALWRVCLTAGDDAVASQAMHDLLGVYIGFLSTRRTMQNGQLLLFETEENFGERIFHCLERVKIDLDSHMPLVERSIERCMRILNAAIGQAESDGLTTIPTLARLSALSNINFSLDDAIRCLPHGMRAQSCCRRIGVLAKRSSNQNTSNFDNASVRNQPTVKFSLDVHPLETLGTLKYKVALHCQCTLSAVKPVQINGRARISSIDPAHMSLTVVPEDTVMDELGVVQGCEIVFVIAERFIQANAPVPPPTTQRSSFSNDLSSVFFENSGKYADQLFTIVLDILEKLTWKDPEEMSIDDVAILHSADIHRLVWDLLHALPTNERVATRVKSICDRAGNPSAISSSDSMEVDIIAESWSDLLDNQSFDRAVYVLKTIDALLQPAPEALSIFPSEKRLALEKAMIGDANSFRRTFIEADGFNAVVSFFSYCGKSKEAKTRQGNAVALRILKSCLFGLSKDSLETMDPVLTPDTAGLQLLHSLSDATGLLKSLTAMVVEDSGISSSTILDVLRFLRLLFQSPSAAECFVKLPDARIFLGILLMWDESPVSGRISLSVNAALQVRTTTHDLILQTPALVDNALPWLIHSIESVDVDSESTSEYFDVLEKLISDSNVMPHSKNTTTTELRNLANIVCKKLAMVPRPGSETDLNDVSTGVLSGCLKIIRALVEFGGGSELKTGVSILFSALGTEKWSEFGKLASRGVLSLVSAPFSTRILTDDAVLLDLMGVVFDGFLSPGGSSSVAICCDKDSRARGFDVIGAAAKRCNGPDGYLAIARRIDSLVSLAAPKLRHRWGQFGSNNEHNSRNRVSKYAGLRNQGCTCYMNSFLQQLFMMPDIRKTLCTAKLPAKLRSVGSKVAAKGTDLVGKKISLQWDSGATFDAMVESFDEKTDMHTILYCPVEIAVSTTVRQQINPSEVARLPPTLPEEFVLSEGRPGKETGVFDIVPDPTDMDSSEAKDSGGDNSLDESEDEAMSRHLLEEVQRTFIHLEEGSRGQCFDPRALVEACSFLKLEFDVWQQNDASEFATKLLDRLEISLKKWAPETFHSMDHTFGLKQTKQKTCKKCGLKTNREEKLLTIDCQIRGKSDIQEALSAMTEVEIMEGSNQVYCDRCKENTDTILKSAISTFPNVLILSLKRFDLDYNTFETVKLNSRCAFGQTLNMKRYSLDAVEALELTEQEGTVEGDNDPNSMDSESMQYGDGDDPLNGLPDDKYEYQLAGVLVHAGVAQGGHYYSFIKDRMSGADEKWYRFDDDDVTPFNPGLIETECFGGKIKKETKWPNGQIHTVEQEQFANALMVFYEKVIPNEIPPVEVDKKNASLMLTDHSILSGYDVFEPDVSRSNEVHRWQSFLFDSEFRGFLKSLLRFCHRPKVESKEDIDKSWRAIVIQMLLSYTFDVLAYSSDYANMNEWSLLLEEILMDEAEIASTFVHKLAKRSRQVSSNWLRTYIMDCPDHSIRGASLRIMMAAIRSTCNVDIENKNLVTWQRAWREQVAALHSEAGDGHFVVPCYLQGQYRGLEDTGKIGSSTSSLGLILSFTSAMIEAVPRYWRFSAELCIFIRFMATLTLENGEAFFRRPMIECQIPARIIALIARDRTPTVLRVAFPGSSVAPDVATTQMRPESNPNVHTMHMSGNSVLNASDLNSPRGPSLNEYILLFEALACLAGIKGMNHATLIIRETDDVVRGRQWLSPTDEVVRALSIIFQECCAQGAPGMGQREIELYLIRSGADIGAVSTQKIHDMLSKYPTTSSTDKDRATYLSLEGFIAYYRDCVQNDDIRLRTDLHVFGFRPDLTRRSRESRYFKIGERESQCLPVQSVALDVAEMFNEKQVQLGGIADYGLAHTPHLYSVASDVDGPLMEYLVAAATYRKNTDVLIDRTLVSIYVTSGDWEGNKFVTGATAILEVIAAVPGDDQQMRISRIMLSSIKAQRNIEFGSGILVVLRALYQMQQSQQYRNDVNWTFNRYLHLLKELYSLYPIFKWMSDNRAHWSFVEREFESARSNANNDNNAPPNQSRTDYSARESETILSTLDRHTNSDSELGMQDSEEDEDDSHFDNVDVGAPVHEGPTHIVVEGAGNHAVNGTYIQDGVFEHAIRYVRDGLWNNARHHFYIFLCNVSNNTKHWYISIVPHGANPGTSSDIDFYTAPITEDSIAVPPKGGWAKTGEGKDPAPRLIHRVHSGDPIISTHQQQQQHQPVGNGTIVEDDGDDDPQSYL